jgi:hypothetical protein
MCRRLQVEERMLSKVSGIKSSRVVVANSMFEGTWSCDVLCIVRVSLIRRKGSWSIGTAVVAKTKESRNCLPFT